VPWRRPQILTTLRALAAAVDFKAGYTPGHSDGVAYLLAMMGREAGYDHETTLKLELAALLHDTGKLRLPDSILLAERPLRDDEFEIVRMHPVWSSEIAEGFEHLGFTMPWVRHHHEHFDGSGYPARLTSDEIPWPSRMMLVADAFHVMTTDRPYQRARTRAQALDVLHARAGSQFCPAAVALLDARQLWRPPDADDPLSQPPLLVDWQGFVVHPQPNENWRPRS
jgi:HD-GYP domain-containing protein (c-di-GMP phosphodiesterase class II)